MSGVALIMVRALVHCLICARSPSAAARPQASCIYIRQCALACVKLTHMYHFAWANQREKQGYKCDVSLKRGIQIICTLENDATLYIDTTKPLVIVGLNLLILSP